MASLDNRPADADGRGELNLPDPHTESPPEAASGKELKAKIAAAIDELPEMQRQALVLFSIANPPPKEVAQPL